jgi:prenyltransferase beta subunit
MRKFFLSLFLISVLLGTASALKIYVTQEGDGLRITSDEPAFFVITVNSGVPIFAGGTDLYFKPIVEGSVEIRAEGKDKVVVRELNFTHPKTTPLSEEINYWWSGIVRLPYGYFFKESEEGNRYKIEWRTALGALEMATRKGGFDYTLKTTDWGPFVKCIAGKCEGSEGAFSGWMYQVNGKLPAIGAHEYGVWEYDEVIWFFAGDMETTPQTSSKVIRIFVLYNHSVLEEGLNESLSLNQTINQTANQTANKMNQTFPLSFDDARIERALMYLKSLQQANGGFANPGEEPSLSKTSWAIMAIVAAKQNPESWKKANSSAMDYMERELPNQLKLMGTADFARTILALYAAGKNPRDFAGVDLVEQLKSKLKENGQIGDFTYTTIWGLMALKVSGENVSKTVEWLISQQNADGGFGWAPGQPSDYDDTAAAIQALVSANVSCDSEVIRKAFEYLKTGQNADGGFRYFGNSSSNAASDSWAIQAIVACNMDPAEWKRNRSVVEHLLSLQQSDGSFNYTAFQRSNPGYMTASAIIALLGKPFPLKPTEYLSTESALIVQTPVQIPSPTPTSTPVPAPTPTPAAQISQTPPATVKPVTNQTPPPKIPGFDASISLAAILVALLIFTISRKRA